MRPHKTPLLDRLAELREEAAAASGREKQVRAERQAVIAEAASLREQVTEAYASGDDDRAARLHAKRVKADEAAAGPWAERIAGAERAMRRAEAERDAFVSGHYAQLVKERAPMAHRAVRRIEGALRELVEARHEWHVEEREQIALTRAVGNLDGRAIPGLGGADELAKLAQRVVGSVPAPLPQALQSGSIAAIDDPGREVREAARARIKAGEA
jgi:hypothetical protein